MNGNKPEWSGLAIKKIRQENPRAATRGFSFCATMDMLVSFAYTYNNIGKVFFQEYFVSLYFFSSGFFVTFSIRI